MIGEREDFSNETVYGTLIMRSYDIDGNQINAFYDDSDDLVFVLDNTIKQNKPNVLLVINPDGDKKWDEILSGKYDVDLETIRPKQDNKYQKLDIEYSGLSVYENLINAYVAGDDLTEYLIQLNILRDSAARHSAMIRLNVANDIIAKTNVTVVKTKETIIRLQERIKSLREKLTGQKKEIGKVPTKQSASKILKLESQIEATNEKLKRAKQRLNSAQKRLETATVDAELASTLLNQPALEINHAQKMSDGESKTVMVAPRYEVQSTQNIKDNDFDIENDDSYEDVDSDDTDDNTENNDNEIKPLFDENPNILNEDIAFKPISFDTPVFNTLNNKEQEEPSFDSASISESVPVLETETPVVVPEITEQKPVLESMIPVKDDNEIDNTEEKPVLETFTPFNPIESNHNSDEQISDVAPIVNQRQESVQSPAEPNTNVPPVAPIPVINTFNTNNNETPLRSAKPSVVYYMLLIVLICLSVLTLWLYQKNIGASKPLLIANMPERIAVPLPEETAPKNKVIETRLIKKADKVEPVQKTQSEDEYVFEEEIDEEIVVPVQSDTNTATNNDNVSEYSDDNATEPVIESDTETSDIDTDVVDSNIEESVSSDDLAEESAIPEVVSETGNTTDGADVDKPVYDAGSKYDDMFISEQDYQEPDETTETHEEDTVIPEYEE